MAPTLLQPTQSSSRETPGKTWYEWSSDSHGVGVTDDSGQTFVLHRDETADQITLTVKDALGDPLQAIAITKPSP